jgi:hypothetical protein
MCMQVCYDEASTSTLSIAICRKGAHNVTINCDNLSLAETLLYVLITHTHVYNNEIDKLNYQALHTSKTCGWKTTYCTYAICSENGTAYSFVVCTFSV